MPTHKQADAFLCCLFITKVLRDYYIQPTLRACDIKVCVAGVITIFDFILFGCALPSCD